MSDDIFARIEQERMEREAAERMAREAAERNHQFQLAREQDIRDYEARMAVNNAIEEQRRRNEEIQMSKSEYY